MEETEIDEHPQCSGFINERTLIRLEKLVDNHPEGIWCSELPALYKKEYNLDLEYLDLGFYNITEFVNKLPDIFVIVEPENTYKQMVISRKQFDADEKSSNHQKETLASIYNYNDYIAKEPQPIPLKLVCRNY